MASFGNSLRRQREEHGVALEDISTSTRVSVRHLEALEADDFQSLPGGVFNKGIVRSYARCVGMDEDAVVQQFMSACRAAGIADPTEKDWTEFAQNVSAQRKNPGRRMRWVGVLLMLLVVLGGAAAVYVMLMRQGKVPVPHFHRKRAETGSAAAQILDFQSGQSSTHNIHL